MGLLSAGDFAWEVTIQERSLSDGSTRFPVESWDDLDTVLMAKAKTTGNERFKDGQNAPIIELRWQMYWQENMDPDSVDVQTERRLIYQGRIYDIVAAIEIGRQEGIELWTIASSRVDEA